jgi:hypothetical protein
MAHAFRPGQPRRRVLDFGGLRQREDGTRLVPGTALRYPGESKLGREPGAPRWRVSSSLEVSRVPVLPARDQTRWYEATLGPDPPVRSCRSWSIRPEPRPNTRSDHSFAANRRVIMDRLQARMIAFDLPGQSVPEAGKLPRKPAEDRLGGVMKGG